MLGTRRVGHAGTLDPMATGVLVVGANRATRLLGHLSLTTKSYTATIRLGQATVTDDAEGDVVAKSGADEFRAQRADFTFRPGGRPLLATLDEKVVLVARSGRFESQSASFDFDEQGMVTSATLTGDPVGDVAASLDRDVSILCPVQHERRHMDRREHAAQVERGHPS